MVRISAVFIAGILLALVNDGAISPQQVTVFLIIFTLLYLLILIFLRRSPSIKLASGTVGLGAIFLGGYLNVQLKNESRQADHILNFNCKIEAYQVKLISPAEEKAKSWKRVGTVLAVRSQGHWLPASGKVNLYWPRSETRIAPLDYGDVLLIKGAPREVESPYNPYEFDFKRFLGSKNIYHQQFVGEDVWRPLRASAEHGFLFHAHRARNWSVAVLENLISSPREQGIVIALVLGVTDGLDTELLNAYAAGGTMHVLAVSGLHVSIIYGILLFFFRPLNGKPGGQWIIAIVSLVLLWAYAFITGLSPSVLRAVAMFSFVAISKPMGRSTNIYNTLAASAFCILIYDPYLIMSVGFQLSYLAVLGIVYLQRPLYNLWVPKSEMLNWAWQITCVSIAAQVATFGLGLLYFHQFPIYFLLANLFVIPGSFVVLVAGILLLILSPFTTIASWLAFALEWFVRILNEGVFLVEQLPFSLINHIYISASQSCLLFLFILTTLILIRYRKFNALYGMMASVILFALLSWHHFNNDIRPPRWTVYRVQGNTAMEWSYNGRSLFVADSTTMKDTNKIHFHIEPNRLFHGVTHIQTSPASPLETTGGFRIYRWEGTTFLHILSRQFRPPQRLVVDYLIISHNSIPSLRSLASKINFQHLIIDSSNSYRYCERLEREAEEMHKPAFSVLKRGAFTLNL